MRNRASDLRIPRFDTLVLSHRDFGVSEVCYEVHMPRFLHTARISNVDSVMFVPHSCENRPFSTPVIVFARFRNRKKTLSSLILNNMEKAPRVWTVLWKRCMVEHAHESIFFPLPPLPLATFQLTV